MEVYDALKSPDPKQWLALTEAERIDLVFESHAGEIEDLEEEPDEAEHRLRAHASIHVVVETQIAQRIEPVCQALKRLMNEGLDRHDALHAIGSVLAGHIYEIIRGSAEVDPKKFNELYHDRLRKLTAVSWRNQSPE
jgi:hypothetical protein